MERAASRSRSYGAGGVSKAIACNGLPFERRKFGMVQVIQADLDQGGMAGRGGRPDRRQLGAERQGRW